MKDRDEGVAVTALPVDAQPRQVRQRPASRVFGEDRCSGHLAIQDLQRPIENDIVVGRVEENEVGGFDGVWGGVEPAHDVSADKMCAFLEAERVQVLAQDSKTAGLLVHEGDPRRAT